MRINQKLEDEETIKNECEKDKISVWDQKTQNGMEKEK